MALILWRENRKWRCVGSFQEGPKVAREVKGREGASKALTPLVKKLDKGKRKEIKRERKKSRGLVIRI